MLSAEKITFPVVLKSFALVVNTPWVLNSKFLAPWVSASVVPIQIPPVCVSPPMVIIPAVIPSNWASVMFHVRPVSPTPMVVVTSDGVSVTVDAPALIAPFMVNVLPFNVIS